MKLFIRCVCLSVRGVLVCCMVYTCRVVLCRVSSADMWFFLVRLSFRPLCVPFEEGIERYHLSTSCCFEEYNPPTPFLLPDGCVQTMKIPTRDPFCKLFKSVVPSLSFQIPGKGSFLSVVPCRAFTRYSQTKTNLYVSSR